MYIVHVILWLNPAAAELYQWYIENRLCSEPLFLYYIEKKKW